MGRFASGEDFGWGSTRSGLMRGLPWVTCGGPCRGLQAGLHLHFQGCLTRPSPQPGPASENLAEPYQLKASGANRFQQHVNRGVFEIEVVELVLF